MKSVGNWERLDMKYKLSELMDVIGGGTPKTLKPNIGMVISLGYRLRILTMTVVMSIVRKRI